MNDDVPMTDTPQPTTAEEDYVMVEKPEEDISDLQSSLDGAAELLAKYQLSKDVSALISSPTVSLLQSVLKDEEKDRYSAPAVAVKEQAIYNLTKFHCWTASEGEMDDIVGLLTGETCSVFFERVTKAKCARVIRQVLDLVCELVPEQFGAQEAICRQIIAWCTEQKRSFLRQRVEAKLATVLYSKNDYQGSLELIDELLVQLKKLDDKQLLVETHLIESKVHFALRGFQKAKAALTASRTAANAIYVNPTMQATIDSMSGILHCEEGDYSTAHSYFLEAFEQLDQLDDRKSSLPCLKYMMLCRTLDALTKALKISAMGGVGK